MTSPSDCQNAALPAANYVFLLFVAGDEPNSRQARQNLKELCAEELRGRSRTEVVDVLQNHEAAVEHKVLLTPTLLSLKPGPEARIIGNLNDRTRVRAALRLDERHDPAESKSNTEAVSMK